MKSAATKRTSAGELSSLTMGDQLLQARFDRFLCRVFSGGGQSGWLLKGGTGLLARVPHARRTQDVDLAASAGGLEEAVEDLRRRVSVDLGDHLRFELARIKETGLGETQPGVSTRLAVFSCWDGRRRLGDIKVDIVVGPAPTGVVDVLEPSGRLVLPRELPSHPYRLFPLVDQVAEKVSATLSMAYPGGLGSSRVKDLVDLVVIARTQTIELRALQLAIATQAVLSRVEVPERFTVPKNWERPYRAMAAATPPAAATPDVAAALELMDEFLTPALAPKPVGDDMRWSFGHGWTDHLPATLPQAEANAAENGEVVWVRPHVRDGKPVAGHWRGPRNSDQ